MPSALSELFAVLVLIPLGVGDVVVSLTGEAVMEDGVDFPGTRKGGRGLFPGVLTPDGVLGTPPSCFSSDSTPELLLPEVLLLV